MNETQREAVANANAHLNNAALPSYSELAEALRRLSSAYDKYAPSSRRHERASGIAFEVLSRIPD